ncbi:hypothetical protein D1007_30462 [Hordeum vulgare]|uniref:Uncharacterized protein n=1 Tax=Hordeum vulgare subsp. vulgare TaxID=112509 RepID=A0A8I7B2T5_HORVV|nr:hypothetical protein D1007_30462 [Hordeum vulgare]KAI5021489.1 hypothetical protein ZWY2020_058219 [Hordeum vulgare]
MTRSKTLVGVRISTLGGMSLQRIRRPGDMKVVRLVSKNVYKLMCHNLGIIRDGEDVTVATLNKFAATFKDQLAPYLIIAMREFFHLGDPAVNSIEDVMIDHGGQDATNLVAD